MNQTEIHKLIQLLRFQVTINTFKKYLIGGLHKPGEAQEDYVFSKLQIDDKKIKGRTILSEETWKNWFNNTYDSMKLSKAVNLDLLGKEKIILKIEGDSQPSKLPDRYFEELYSGGLVSHLLVTTRSKAEHKRDLLVERANNYTPISFLHLHLDAIEVNAITKYFHDVSWNEIMEIASRRILELLLDDWGPRYGRIYSSFSSPLKLKWDEADESERKQLREFYSRFQPDIFEEKMQPGAEPDWGLIGVGDDIAPQHIYKALFAMAADTDFLVEDRLKEWTLSLATAALAMHALAWSDRYTTFGFQVTEEMVYWGAFNVLFFNSEKDDIDCKHLRSAMKRCRAEWDESAFDVFTAARKIYHDELADCGTSFQDIMCILKAAKNAHPQTYRR